MTKTEAKKLKYCNKCAAFYADRQYCGILYKGVYGHNLINYINKQKRRNKIMHTSEELTSLLNLAEGAAIEMFDLELVKALKNIDDPNSSPKAAREITLTVKLVPTETKGIVSVSIFPKTKLAGRNAVTTHLLYGKDHRGNIEAHELHQQRKLWDDHKIVLIGKKEDTE